LSDTTLKAVESGAKGMASAPNSNSDQLTLDWLTPTGCSDAAVHMLVGQEILLSFERSFGIFGNIQRSYSQIPAGLDPQTIPIIVLRVLIIELR
jgi:hypothetical protein